MIRWLYGTAAVEDGEIVVRRGGIGWGGEQRRPVKWTRVGRVDKEDGTTSLVLTCGNLSPIVLEDCREEADVRSFLKATGGH